MIDPDKLDFEWNRTKVESNLLKRNVVFEEATTVFGDTFSIPESTSFAEVVAEM